MSNQLFNQSSTMLNSRLALLFSLIFPASASMAQSTVPANAPESSAPSISPAETKESAKTGKDGKQQVIVTGTRGSDTDQRRQASAAKLIFGREELDRNGDTSLGEVLKRLPGVSIGGRAGRGGDIRMRGMGGGYTQILLNGERAPRGFSLESLSPDQVERIEVIRGSVAEHSTQAIAGTINIILREGYQQRDVQLNITDTLYEGKHVPNIGLTVPGKYGNLTYTLAANIAQNERTTNTLVSNYDFDSSGGQLFQENSDTHSHSHSDSFNISPRLAWKFDNGDTLTLQTFAMHNHNQEEGRTEITEVQGVKVPQFNSARWKTDSTFTMGRLFGNWITKIGDGRLDSKFGVNSFFNESETPRQEYFYTGALQQTLLDRTSTRERGANLSTKYSISVGDGHLLAAGVEAEWSKRIQTRLALVNGVPDAFNDAGDDDLSASSRRYAAFVQDEWDINKQWSVNLGLRWEGINVKSAATAKLPAVDNQSSVLSPIAHAVWKIPGMERDQVRMSATHSYRAPPLANLIATPALSHNNSATSPDRHGNPNLKPEQAIGLELAYEHYLSEGGILSVNFFNRHIKQLMRRVAKEENTVDGLRWISRPVNIGNADTRGVELEAKFRLAQLMENAPNIDLRANYSWAWSAVDGINGPYNRIDSQPKHTANLGIDYRPANSPLSIGGSLNWTPGYLIQTSPEQLTSTGLKRQLDVYALWKINSYTQLRLAANNLMPRDALSNNSVQDGGITHFSDSVGPTDTQWSLRLEMKL